MAKRQQSDRNTNGANLSPGGDTSLPQKMAVIGRRSSRITTGG